ncbi:MAG TPA: DUF2785 domain-containing protein [Acidimicrobiales bacterium]
MDSLSLDELIGLLASTDPKLRDDLAYCQLAIRIESGTEDQHLRELGDQLVVALSDEAVQTRTFSALVLGCIVERSNHIDLLARETLLRWLNSFANWYRSETDLRGWDEELGWLHAVAHGAGAIGAFAGAPELQEDDLVALLALVVDRLLTPTSFVFREQEDERLGRAAAIILCRSEMSNFAATVWLESVTNALSDGEPGPTPPWVSNTLRTLRVIYIIVDRGFQKSDTLESHQAPHREDITTAIAFVLRLASPYTAEF